MDRYVIRRSKEDSATTRSDKKGYKQMSLHSLKGVVVMEDIAKLNRLLRVPDQDPTVLHNSLEQLSQKLPSRDILKSTKIGHAVKRLTSHSDKSVSQLARRVLSSWKNHFEEKLSRPSLDVRCDHATTESRETVRRHITTTLCTDSEDETLTSSVAESLEFELFRQHRQLMSSSYRRSARRLVFRLRQSESLRREVFCKNQDCRTRLITEICCGKQNLSSDDGDLAQTSQGTASEPIDCS